MHGKVIQFKANIDNFKVKNGFVTINLTTDTKDIALDQLIDMFQGSIFVSFEASQTEMVTADGEPKHDTK